MSGTAPKVLAASCHCRFADAQEVDALREIEHAAAQRFADIGMLGIALAPLIDASFVADKIARHEALVAAGADDVPVGFVLFTPGATRFHIDELDVLPAYAGHRIGSMLIDAVGRRARALGATHLTLSTFREVPWNAPYYRRIGFRDMPDALLDDELRARRAAHLARGLDESKRVFMRREIELRLS